MVTIYTTKTCGYCPMVKKYLTMKNVQFTEVDVTSNPEARQQLFKRTGMSTVPVTLRDENYVVGFQPSLLAKLIV